ncbi:hypothetical protein WISP_19304 [Willisornis vidua]|uniref:Uncharacterized protein n=1 Tax=Willisornis vidua TaxID=1566151 RepID=A0ABQ9DS00_9PASS|nr:hypothetical protein WISP_19304 [Willisornis vidua]
MKLNKGKYWILYQERDNPGCLYRLGNELLKSSAMEGDLGVLVNDKVNMSHQCPESQEGQPCPGRHQAQHCQPGTSYPETELKKRPEVHRVDLTGIHLGIPRVPAWSQDLAGFPNTCYITGGPNEFTTQSHSQEKTIKISTFTREMWHSHQAREVKNYFRLVARLSSGVMMDVCVLRQARLLPAHPNASSHSQHSTSLSSKVIHAMFTSICRLVAVRD